MPLGITQPCQLCLLVMSTREEYRCFGKVLNPAQPDPNGLSISTILAIPQKRGNKQGDFPAWSNNHTLDTSVVEVMYERWQWHIDSSPP